MKLNERMSIKFLAQLPTGGDILVNDGGFPVIYIYLNFSYSEVIWIDSSVFVIQDHW